MKKRTAKVLKRIGLGILVLGVAYGVLYLSASRALQREVDALRDAGRPMRPSDIIPPGVPATENAAPLYQAAINLLKAEPPISVAGTVPTTKNDEQNLYGQLTDLSSRINRIPAEEEALEPFRILMKNERLAEALAIIERGTERPACRHELDYTQGAGLLLPHVTSYRELSGILAAVACQHAADGDAEKAWRTALIGLRFADALKEEPLLISQLVRLAQFSLANESIRLIAKTFPPSAAHLAEIEQRLLSFEDKTHLVRSMDAERLLLGEWAFQLQASKPFQKGQGVPLLASIIGSFKPLSIRDHAAYLRVIHAYTRMAEQPYSPESHLLADRLLQDTPSYAILTRMLIPALVPVQKKFETMITEARTTRNGLAAIRHQPETGTFPTDL